MEIDFNKPVIRKNTNCSKYDSLKNVYGCDDLLPLWIADMDFEVPDEVSASVIKRAQHHVYGYNAVPDGYYESFCNWEKTINGWDVMAEWVCHTPGVLTALSAAVLLFTDPGDKILIQPPVYFPFKSTIETLGRQILNNELVYNDGFFSIDFDDLETKAKEAKMFLFCSPHNPSGRVWTKEELSRIADICQKNNIFVFSDEIHSDIVYKPHKHIVFAQVSSWCEQNSIIAMAPSKTFNLAGLEASFISVPNKEIREKYQHYLRFGLHVANPNSYGLVAAQAAYEHGKPWHESLLEYLKGNIDWLHNELKQKTKNIKLVYPEATYIPLIDMAELRMTSDEMIRFMVDKAKVALNSGATFGPGGERFMRVNIATQRKNLEEFVNRVCDAMEGLV